MRGGWGLVRVVRADDPAALEFPDELDYWSLAQSVVDGHALIGEHGYRALRMPLYPMFLAPFAASAFGTVCAKAAQWFIGAAAAVLAALLATRVAGRKAGLLAGLLVAVDPFLVFFASLLLTETLFITALCGLWLAGWRILRRDGAPALTSWLIVGLLSALCVHLRESALGLVLIWALYLAAVRGSTRTAWVGFALTVVIVVAALFPWALRNRLVTGRWCWLTNRAGISLYDGVGPQAAGRSNLGDIKQMPAVRGLDENAWNRYFLDEAIRSIRSDPGRIVRLAGVKIARTWNPVPNAEDYRSVWVRLISALWTIPVYLVAIVGAVRLRRRPAELVALVLPALFVLGLHSIFVGSVRYRLIAMPMLEVLAAVGLCAALSLQRAKPAPGSTRPPDP